MSGELESGKICITMLTGKSIDPLAVAMNSRHYPTNICDTLEEWTHRPLDQEFIDWFSELPGKVLYDWYFRLDELNRKIDSNPELPPLAPGAVRPFVSAPTYAPVRTDPQSSNDWQQWWHRGTCMLLLCDQVAVTEPLLRALLWDQSSEPPRGDYGAVRWALATLRSLRKLADDEVITWVNATNRSSILEDSPKYIRATLNGWSPSSNELVQALAEIEVCRQVGRINPVIRSDFKGRELKQLQWFLGHDGHEATFADLCSLDIPMMELTLTQLVGLRTTSESFYSLRNDLQKALEKLPEQIRYDRAWQESATDFMSEALGPSYERVKRDLRQSSVLSAALIAGKSTIFTIAGMGVGAAVGGIPTWASAASAGTAATLNAAAGFAAAHKKRSTQKEYLKVLGNFIGKE